MAHALVAASWRKAQKLRAQLIAELEEAGLEYSMLQRANPERSAARRAGQRQRRYLAPENGRRRQDQPAPISATRAFRPIPPFSRWALKSSLARIAVTPAFVG